MKPIESPMKSNRKLVLAIVVSMCVTALLGAVPTVGAKESTAVTPNVVGITVTDAVKTFVVAGFTQVPILHAPGITTQL